MKDQLHNVYKNGIHSVLYIENYYSLCSDDIFKSLSSSTDNKYEYELGVGPDTHNSIGASLLLTKKRKLPHTVCAYKSINEL